MSAHPPPMPNFTCPAIDLVRKAIREAEKQATPHRADDEDALRDRLDNVRDILWAEEKRLEQLREANDALRRNAEWWQERAAELQTLVET